MKILVTNDDGYKAEGLQSLVRLLRPYGELTVVAPKYHQSGMSMAVTMGLKPIAVKKISSEPGETWYYVDGTPASCVKYGVDEIFKDSLPDLVVSGINHGANCASAVCYSGTLGAAREAALADIPAIGVSLDDMSLKADFSTLEKLFPEIFEKLVKDMSSRFGVYYNINFPALPESEIRGVRVTRQGIVHWVKEFEPYDYDIFDKLGIKPEDMGITSMPEIEEGETVYIMKGMLADDPRNTPDTDHLTLKEGYITIEAHNLDSTDHAENERLKSLGFDREF